MKKRLTDLFCKTATSEGLAQKDYFDLDCRALAFRVSSRGKKSWTFTFNAPADGTRVRWTMGYYPQMGLREAHQRADKARDDLAAGLDPRDADKPAPGSKTVADLIEDRLALEVRGKLRTAKAVERQFKKNVIPVVGAMALKDFTVKDLKRVTNPIIMRGAPYEAAQVFAQMRKLFAFGIEQGELVSSPIAGAKPGKLPPSRDRWLNNDEIVVVWHRLPEALGSHKFVPEIIQLLLLTGCRLSEIAGMERSEVDLLKRTLTLPPPRTKNKLEHVVHLSDPALALIRTALEKTNGKWLFPNKLGTGWLARYTIDKAVQQSLDKFGIPQWRPHDLRRTFATGMQALGVPLEVTEAMLNHVSGSRGGIVGVYQRHQYTAERREALDKWAAFLSRLVAGDKVVQLDEQRAA